MAGSILDDVKQACSLASDYTAFDSDILMYINGAFSTLHQLGIGPVEGYQITDNTPTWSDYVAEDFRYNSIKNYIALKTRIAFDPPSTSYHLEAMKQQIQELEWRLNVIREGDTWIDPHLADQEEPDGVVFEGGSA